ncbi:MAG TPA: zinc-dependent metalloprotease, partial [Gemmatimonadaceae bacterium]|nr:zinc-dependent metalloprotease [Gemmatimonadaceae bacterium]
LNEAAFQVPAMFLDAKLLRRIENEGAVDRFRVNQSRVLNSLLSQDRLNRLVEFEALAARPSDVYTLADLFSDLRAGVWDELTQPSVRVNVYRRNLQRAFLAAADTRLNPSEAALTRTNNPAPNPANSDARAALRAALQDIDQMAQAALPKAGDPMTRIHLRDVRTEVARILDVRR